MRKCDGMKKIKMLVKDIKEELHDAEKYAKCYALNKDTDRDLANTFRALAEDELGHADKLHDQAVRIIREYRSSGAEPPAAMQAVWDYEHENMIEEKAEIQAIIAM